MTETATVPRAQLKRERVRNAAQQLFLKSGFGSTSMDAVATSAGVSKPTLYRYYENKEALFADILRDLTRKRIWSDLPTATLESGVRSRAGLTSVLTAIAQSVIHQLLDPTYVGLLRVLIAEIPRFPHLADLFRAAVLGEGPHVLSSVLQRACAAGVVTLPHPEVAARLFIGPLLMYLLTDGLLSAGVPRQPPPEQIAALAELFVKAIA